MKGGIIPVRFDEVRLDFEWLRTQSESPSKADPVVERRFGFLHAVVDVSGVTGVNAGSVGQRACVNAGSVPRLVGFRMAILTS
jgi:hypothetical protein